MRKGDRGKHRNSKNWQKLLPDQPFTQVRQNKRVITLCVCVCPQLFSQTLRLTWADVWQQRQSRHLWFLSCTQSAECVALEVETLETLVQTPTQRPSLVFFGQVGFFKLVSSKCLGSWVAQCLFKHQLFFLHDCTTSLSGRLVDRLTCRMVDSILFYLNSHEQLLTVWGTQVFSLWAGKCESRSRIFFFFLHVSLR